MTIPDRIFLQDSCTTDTIGDLWPEWFDAKISDNSIEYVRTDAFVEKMINFLNYKLDDIVAIRVPGTIITHHVAKQELIEDLRNYMKGE